MCHVTKYCNTIEPHCTVRRDKVCIRSSPDPSLSCGSGSACETSTGYTIRMSAATVSTTKLHYQLQDDCSMFPFVLFGVEDQLIRVNESLQSVVALSISMHCLLFILRIPIIFLPISILRVFVVCGSKPAVSAGQTTNKFLSCLCRQNTHSLGLCILTSFRDYQILVLFILSPHYLSKQSVASFPDCVGVVWE